MELGEIKNVYDLDMNYTFISNSQDIKSTCDSVGISSADCEEITGIFAKLDASGADYAEVWITKSSRPYDTAAGYKLVFKNGLLIAYI